MLTTELGIEMDVSALQAKNVCTPRLTTESGMVIVARLTQDWNVESLMLVTELPRMMDVSLEHPEKAAPPILVTEFGMTTFVRTVQL